MKTTDKTLSWIILQGYEVEKMPLDDLGDLMTVEEYLDFVRCGGFTDWDGMGDLVVGEYLVHKENDEHNSPWIYPSDTKFNENRTEIIDRGFPDWVTHINWYNK